MSSKISKALTIGLELETAVSTTNAATIMRENEFTHHYDGTICGDDGQALPRSGPKCAMEIISKPNTVNISQWYDGTHFTADYGKVISQIEALCACAELCNKSCGFHVHIGLPNANLDGKSKWNPEQIRTTLLIGLALEEKLYAVCPPSRKTSNYCHPLLQNNPSMSIRSDGFYTKSDMASYYPTGVVVPRKSDNPKRYCWLNLIETRRPVPTGNLTEWNTVPTGTVEIRMLGNTSRPKYIISWVKLWVQIMGMVSSIPSSMAIQHSVYAATLDPYFQELMQHRNLGQELRPSNQVNRARPIDRPIIDTPAQDTNPVVNSPLTLPRRGPGRPSNADREARLAFIRNSTQAEIAVPEVAMPTNRPPRQPNETLVEYQRRLTALQRQAHDNTNGRTEWHVNAAAIVNAADAAATNSAEVEE